MEKQSLQLDQKLRSLGFSDPDPALRRRTLAATEDALERRGRDVGERQTAGWWLDGLLAAAVVLMAFGGSLLQQTSWAPVDPRTLVQREPAEHYRQLQEHFDHMPLGFAASAPRATQGPKAWEGPRPQAQNF